MDLWRCGRIRCLHLVQVASCKTLSCSSSTYSGFEYWVLRFRDLGASCFSLCFRVLSFWNYCFLRLNSIKPNNIWFPNWNCYIPTLSYRSLIVSRRGQSNVQRSNPIKLQLFDWVRLGSVIELNWAHPKILLIEHNQTFRNWNHKQPNIIKRCMQQLNIKPVSSCFKQKALCSNKLCIGFNFKHKYAKMSQRADWKTWTILEMMVKATTGARFHRQCPWKVYFL